MGLEEPALGTERATGGNQPQAARALQLLRHLKQLSEPRTGLPRGETPLEEMAGAQKSRRPDELAEVQPIAGELSVDSAAHSPSLLLANP